MNHDASAGAEEADPLIGRTIGSYQILRVLGRGGMGAVYLAEHPIINSQVAIKFLHRQYATDKRVIERFFNEARAVNLIGHPNIIKILDLNVTDDEQHYFVMEFLHGRPLSKMIQPGGVGLGEAGPVLLQCCAALQAAHENNIIHRDLKPDNVYLVSHLGRRNFVKLVDFGIAKLTDTGEVRSGRTQTGTVMGTPAYMSPEQAIGETQNIDARSDVYSLGVMMFQLATGRLPFEDDSFGKLLISQVQKEPPAPRSIVAAIPEQWERVILRTLRKDPAARQQSMNELADELHAAMQELGLSTDLPVDDGPRTEGPGAPRVPSDPGRRRTPGFDSGPMITPPSRRSSNPRLAPAAGPAVEPPRTGSRSVPPTRAAKKGRGGFVYGLVGVVVAGLLAGGLFWSGLFDEEPVSARRARPKAAAEATPAPPAPAPEPAAAAQPPREPAAAPQPSPAAAAPAPEPAATPRPPPAPATPAQPAVAATAPAVETPPAEKALAPVKAEPKSRRVRAAPEAAATVLLSAVSDPPGAEVVARWEGGEKRGKAPLQFAAPKGARVKFDFSLKGYSPSTEEVVADGPRTVTSELVQLLGD